MATKKLAKELGLLRQRSQTSNGLKKSAGPNQIFSYLIVIDFESTCWRENNNCSQEIIEFPAILLNTSTGDIESEFHTYVQPQEHPILSEFCKELTGITQMQVETGIPLQICLSRFNRWLQNLKLNMGLVFPNRQPISSSLSSSQKLCTFLTWSDWDLGVCLQYECKRKQLHKPDVLNSWIDLRSTYRLFYDRKPKGLNGALQDLGIQFAGREHSGLDDSRNTAQLAARMMRDGCMMKITRSLVRTQLMVKPTYGNTTAHNKKEKSYTDEEENQLDTKKNSLSMTSPKSFTKKSSSGLIMRNLDTKNTRSIQKSDQTCRNLISTKTLMNGPRLPLCGNSVTVESITNASSLVMRNSLLNNSNSLVLCSTTGSCTSSEPHQTKTLITGDTDKYVEEEEGAEQFLAEMEDRCDSYDGVVLEDDETERECDYVSDFDSGSHVWDESDDTHFSENRMVLRKCIRTNDENNSKNQEMSSVSSVMLLSTNNTRFHVNVSNHLNDIRQNSTKSEPRYSFAVPKIVTADSDQPKLGVKTCLQPHKMSKTNTTIPVKRKPFMPENTSTPFSSFARPKAVVTQHTVHKQNPKCSFTICTDPPKPSSSSSSSSFCTSSRSVLSSLSTNSISSRASSSASTVTLNGGQRITSPLCACGRRAKRQVVSNGGPNNGRGFYCCPVRRSGSGGRVQKGCEFFKWESALMKRSPGACPTVRSSVSLCQINSDKSCRPSQKSTIRKSY